MQLIAINKSKFDTQELNTVDAKDLHSFLQIGTRLDTWLSRRVEEYGFTQGIDFISSFLSVDNGGDGRTHYYLSIDMAKEICMVEKTEKGKEARKYFIECERKANKLLALPNFNNPVEAARAWADEVEAKERAEKQLALAAPKVKFVDSFVSRDTLQNATQVAQTFKMSAVAMNKHLDNVGGVYNKSVKRGRTFCQSWVDDGNGEMKQTEMGYPQALFTTKGALRVHEIFTSEGII